MAWCLINYVQGKLQVFLSTGAPASVFRILLGCDVLSVGMYRRFGRSTEKGGLGTLHLGEPIFLYPYGFILLSGCSSTMKIEAVGSSETLINFHQTAWCHNSKTVIFSYTENDRSSFLRNGGINVPEYTAYFVKYQTFRRTPLPPCSG
jgi:hypothetical protein